MNQKFNLIAHRGDMTHYPENTMLALENALQLGARYIEFDLQMNVDNDFVVIHDDSFQRTSGIDVSVLECFTKDLVSISVHQPDLYLQQFFPQRVPLLEDVMKLLSLYPQAKAFVEIKRESVNYWGADHIIKYLMKKLELYSDRCILISFDYDTLALIQKQSQLTLGWVLEKYDDSHQKQANQLQTDILICDQLMIPSSGELWSGAWQWMLYDIVDYDKAVEYAKRGITFIETGDITRMMKLGHSQ